MAQLGVAIVASSSSTASSPTGREYRAEKAIDALRQLLPQIAKALRNGQLIMRYRLSTSWRDVILLEAGDNVPADCRLVASVPPRVNASTITGESLPKARSAEDVVDQKSPLETKNVLLADFVVG